MKRIVLTAILALYATGVVYAAGVTTGVMGASTGGGVIIPPSCNNSLDFSQACNSQYFGVVFR